MEQKELTGKIIGAAIRVHRELGPGYLESVYEAALCIELAATGLKFTRQQPVEIRYHGQRIAVHRLDLLVEDTSSLNRRPCLNCTTFSTRRYAHI
jgi:GxxExxY protein